MAVAVTVMAEVPVPTSRVGDASQCNTGRCFIVSLTIQADDYASGVLLTDVATACGLGTITGALVDAVQVAAGTGVFGFGVHDVANNKVRFFSAITNQTTATDYTAVNDDVWRLVVWGV